MREFASAGSRMTIHAALHPKCSATPRIILTWIERLLYSACFLFLLLIDIQKKKEDKKLFSTNEILDLAIQIEKRGEAVYRDAVEMVSNPELVSLLVWMADEEVKHATWFSDLKIRIAKAPDNPFVEEMSRELFNDLLGEKSFSHKDVDFNQVENIDDLLVIFIEFEKDSVLFYEMLAPFIEDDSTQADLKKIIAEENNHIKQLQGFTGSEIALSLDPDRLNRILQ